MERRQWERKLHKNSINFRNREEIGGRKYCQNQLLNRRRTIVEQTNGNSEWDLFSWSGIGISSAERTRVILLKFRRWSSQTQNRVQSRGERLIRVITQSSCVDMIQKKKKEKKGKRYNSFYVSWNSYFSLEQILFDDETFRSLCRKIDQMQLRFPMYKAGQTSRCQIYIEFFIEFLKRSCRK